MSEELPRAMCPARINGRECGGIFEENTLRCSRCRRYRGGWIHYPWTTERIQLWKGTYAIIWRPVDTRYPVRVLLYRPDGVPIKTITLDGLTLLIERQARLKARREKEKRDVG